MQHGEHVDIEPLQRVAGCAFDSTRTQLEAVLTPRFGEPQQRMNFDGELELLWGVAIFRLRADCFVEATFPDRKDRGVRAHIDGLPVLSVYEWLRAQEDVVDIAFFRVSRKLGIAYDRRAPQHHSYTVFAPGHWTGCSRRCVISLC